MRLLATRRSLLHSYSWRLLLLAVLLLNTPLLSRAQVNEGLVPDATELSALRDLYAATGGPKWYTRTNWLQGTTLADAAKWYGVTVTNGDVTGLTITFNLLIGPLPDTFSQLVQLETLNLSGNQLSGSLPDTWGQLAKLQRLDLSSNRLNGQLPTTWSQLTQLSYLNLNGNQFSGQLPDAWGQLAKLQQLYLHSNYQLSGPLPTTWGQLAQLQTLDLGSSHFSGSLPTTWGQLAQLQQLDLSSNQLSGPLPDTWGKLAQLYSLNLSVNQLSGPLPDTWGQLAKLDRLDLSSNQLSGPLPTMWSQLAQLRILNLSGNQLSGLLPDTWGQLAKLQQLNLYSNQLSGSLPAALITAPALWLLSVGDNKLTGLPAYQAGAVLSSINVANNYISFASLESYYAGGKQQLVGFSYAPQLTPPGTDLVKYVRGATLTLSRPADGAHTVYQWEQQVGTAWVAVAGGTSPTLTIPRATEAQSGLYRLRETNTWVLNLTLYPRYLSAEMRPSTPDDPSDDLDRNWTLERSFDGNGNEVAASKQFTDGLGRATQAQARNAAAQQVFASQTIYNTGGQPVLQTLAAPTNNQSFNYREDFVNATVDGKSTTYGPTQFEGTNASNPTPVEATTIGTLGYYYSKLNEQEPLTPITSYPYSLVEPYEGPLGGTRRAAGPGDELRMGKGRETKGRDFPLRKEFDDYLRLRPQLVPGSPLTTLEYQGTKSVSINADGRESIVVSNKEGQALISCLSGPQYPALPVFGYLSAEASNAFDPDAPVYQDVHIPAAGPQDVKFTGGGSVRIVNLLTADSYDYPVTAVTTVTPVSGSYPSRISPSETYVTLAPGFYRLVSLSGTQGVYYEAHYGDFSYTYYDDAGRAVASIAPKGVAEVLPITLTTTAHYRIRAAQSAPLTTARGTFTGDQYYSPTPGSTSATNNAIAGTTDQALYQSERYGQQFAYALPVPNGTYTVVLHFAETYWHQAGQRVFNVSLEKALVLDHYDITKKVGSFTATTETFTVPVTDGVLNVDFTSAIAGGADNAKISALEVLTTTASSSGQALHYVTHNTYDTSGRLLATESDDEGRSEYVYAQDGRIRFSQSALQRKAGRFSYSNYDEVGRVVESGEYTPGTLTFENHLTATPAPTSILQTSVLEDRTRSGGLLAASCAQRNQVWYDLPWDASPGSPGDNTSKFNGRTQEFVVGAVAKTQNDNVTTWYSYDELGRVTWVVQDIKGVGVKTLDYTYDFSGNVLAVAYQKGQADAFTHSYNYDAAQRLTTVYTSTDGVVQTLQAEYSYYLHGPLKRVQVAGNLQGVDYVYTLQGALKSINHTTSALEPGQDSPETTGMYKDLFALTLEYFSGDYRSKAIDVPAPPVPGTSVADRYDGTIRSASWRTAARPDIQRMAYTYDEKSQLQNSTYSNWQLINKAYQLNATSTNSFQEGGLSYDANGNMLALRRTGATGTTTDDFTYTYKANTNQLQAVHTASAPATDPAVLDYDYDELGQMTRQRDEQGQHYFTYDVTGKTTGVYLDAAYQQPVVTFAYDDRGFRVSKTAYPATGAPATTTTYVRDVAGNILATYAQVAPTGPWQRTEVPLYGASRLGSLTHLDDGTANGTDDYRYELNDHLGAARVVFHRPSTEVNVETMELAGVPTKAAFLNDDLYRVAVSGAPSGDYVARLTDSQPLGQELKRVLRVTKGDTITFSALAQWKQNAAAGGTGATPFLLAGAAAGVNSLSQRGAEGQTTAYATTSPNWLSLLAAGLGFTLGQGNQPASLGATSLEGWIKYRVLDEQGQEVATGRDYLLGTGKWEYLQTGVRVEQNGTIEVMAGTSGSGEAVYFDNLRVEQTGGLIVQEQHQYAFGSPLPGLSYTVGNKRYRYGYQGQYAEHDDETGFESFELRLYNSRVGRWMSYDPEGQFDSPYVGMGNNPVSGVDPDGGWSGPPGHWFSGGFRYGTSATKGLSKLTKLGMQLGSSALRSVSSTLEAGDNWVHSDAGEKTGRFVASLVGAEQLGSIYTGFTEGTDVYGDSQSKAGTAWQFASFALVVVPGASEAAGAGKVAAATAEATEGAAILLNPGIKATAKGLTHTLTRHTVNGIAKFANKSKFFNITEVETLITQATHAPMVRQASGNFQRVVDAGRNIGVDRLTGNTTSIYTVITNKAGELVTAFPGIP